MRLTNLTRELEIGANSYLLESDHARIVLDAGLHPKRDGLDGLPDFRPLAGAPRIDCVLVTHAHQDHVGSLPVLCRQHPEAKVFCSGPSRDLMDAMLHNSVSVMKKKRLSTGDEAYPLFTHREVVDTVRGARECPLRTRWTLRGERLAPGEEADGGAFEFHHAGHILGSTGVLLELDGRRVFYTGDVNFDDQTVSQGAAFPGDGVDVLIMETTRGDSPQADGFTRRAEEERFIAELEESFGRGGCTLVPVFALGKTQEVLGMVHKYRRSRALSSRPLYIGGLSTKVSRITDRNASSWPRQFAGLGLIEASGALTLKGRDITRTPVDKPRIYALSSGMMTEKTLSNAFARRILSHPKCSLFFVGYTDPESPAGRIRTAGEGGWVTVDPQWPEQEIRCAIREFNFSAHGSRESLLDYAVRLGPKTVVLVHGDPPAIEWFRAQLAARLPDTRVVLPRPGEPVDL